VTETAILKMSAMIATERKTELTATKEKVARHFPDPSFPIVNKILTFPS
jgi:hypothetical protein